MRPSHRCTPLIALLVLCLCLRVDVVEAQAGASNSVAGTVTSLLDGRPVSGAIVSLVAVDGGFDRETVTDGGGRFSLTLVTAGLYEMRVEAFGYRPLVVRTLSLVDGAEPRLSLGMTAAQPPVVSVDTLEMVTIASGRTRAGATRFRTSDLDDVPHRYGDLASIAALSSRFDESLGWQGLPGDLTTVVADGVPVFPAPHPSARADVLPYPVFSRATLAGVTAFDGNPDLAWPGTAGGYLGVNTTQAAARDGLGFEGAYSGGPTWSSSEIDGPVPSLLSFEGTARGSFTLSPEGTRLGLTGSALRHQTPLGPRVTETLATQLAGIDPDLLAALGAPSLESYSRYVGLARLDASPSPTSRVFFRGAGGLTERSFDDAGPVSLTRSAALAEKSIDFSVAGGLVSEYSSELTLQLLAGLSGSDRDFPGMSGAPSVYLTDSGTQLGSPASGAGASSRTDLVFLPSLSFAAGDGSVDFGVPVRVSSHRMSHSRAPSGDLRYSDPSALLAGQGAGSWSTASVATFSSRELGFFAEYRGTVGEGLDLSLGARFDRESFSLDELAANDDWFAATGLRNDSIPSGFNQVAGRASLEWTPSNAEGTRFFASASVASGDVDTRAIYEVMAGDVDASWTEYLGAGVEWPVGGGPPATAVSIPTLTLFGPDTRAPRSANLGFGFSQSLSQTVLAYARGSLRRTDFLLRRRNLNLPVGTATVDEHGREVFGTLQQDGGLVTGSGARRFDGFADVWALDPDGWSKQRALTVGLEHTGSSLDLTGSYTYSETTDNWVGAASGLIDATLPPGLPDDPSRSDDWTEGTSDYDVPHRVSAGARVRAGFLTLSGSYQYRSGLPFTPGYRDAVDANGDGSFRNDVAFVPGDAQLAVLLDRWPCLEDQAGGFATRNSCRGDPRHAVNARIRVELMQSGARAAHVFVDVINLVESGEGVRDRALMLVDPTGSITTSPGGGTVTLPAAVNPGFGDVLYPTSRGRMIRVGLRVGV